MFALVVALAATIVLTPTAFAQDSESDGQYYVWSSVVVQRTGERTPEIIGDGSTPVMLTSIGANQAYESGAWFRRRYIDAQIKENRNGTNGAFDAGAPLWGLNTDIYSNLETYAMSLDQQWNVATAYAFFQGLYPPASPGNSSGSSTMSSTSWTSDNQYISAPLNGYQYPQIHTSGALDPNFIYLSANLDCPSFDAAAADYLETTQYSVTQDRFDGIYDAIGSALLKDVIPFSTWDYRNAYAIYDFLRYQYAHNSTAKAVLDRYKEVATNTSYLDVLKWLADEQQYAQLGNLTATNEVTGSSGWPNGAQGSISTIAGNFLASKVVSLLQEAVGWGGEMYKLNLLFTDFYPLTSFFALTQLPLINPSFYGTPSFGSSLTFELFSTISNETSITFPDEDKLWVRFYFRNGTSDEDEFQSYSLFDLGPSHTDMTWRDFQQQMGGLMVADVGDWCTLCGATNLFCQAYNQSEGDAAVRSWLDGHGISGSGNGGMKPAVAGVIGAIVALGIAGLLFALAMLIGGVRFHRNQSRRSSDLGGFKGGQKMASDQDLTIPKGGAMVGASVETEGPMSPAGGHERVGSWELKNAEAGKMGLSFEGEPDDFQHPVRPVTPHERV